jgi:hypothetical protein
MLRRETRMSLQASFEHGHAESTAPSGHFRCAVGLFLIQLIRAFASLRSHQGEAPRERPHCQETPPL